MLAIRLLGSKAPSGALNAGVRRFFQSVPRSDVRFFRNRKLLGFFGATTGLNLALVAKLRRAHCNAQLEDPWLLVPEIRQDQSRSIFAMIIASPWTVVVSTWIVLRKLLRCISLFCRFVPIAVVYPIATRVQSLENLWWTCFIFCIQTSGPTFLKLGQWASTRRDIFSKTFCDRLSVLHTKTKKRRIFDRKAKIIDEVFGKGFYKKHANSVFTDYEPYSIGSGCIAQVYKMTVDVPALERATGKLYPELRGKERQQIAIKVAEKGVEQQIELDLSIIRSAVCITQRLFPSLTYVDPMGAIEQFEMVLRRQVDLRNEARALMKFSANFDAAKTGIKFPKVIGYTKEILIETYEDGIYINRLVSQEDDPELHSRQAPAVRRRIALLGARALLKMIFVDNFVHGDLHPGNISIRFNDAVEVLPGVHLAPPPDGIVTRAFDRFRSAIGWRSPPKVRFTDSPYMQDEPTLVLLDTGIAISETPEKLSNLKKLFRCIVEKKGYDAGKLLLSHGDNNKCKEPERFCEQVDSLVNRAMSERSLRKLNISGLLSEMFSVVSEHGVSLDSSFTTVVLSVMVLEGFGRSLDPDLDLFQCARPYLLNVMF